MTATEMKMLKISAGVMKIDRIRSSFIRGILHVKEPIADKIQRQAQGWWDHVKRRPETNPVQTTINMDIPRKSKRGKPKKFLVKAETTARFGQLRKYKDNKTGFSTSTTILYLIRHCL